ncbi:MAG: serine/threonine protein kinase [Pirellulales bacterium]|nr:serine/threonine protein kinase [Pirellulales bacterium]
MIDAIDERDPVELLAEEFASRCRRGERPSVSDYALKYPQYAERIQRLFPAVGMLEQLRTQETSDRKAVIRQARSAGPPDHLGDFDILREIGRGGMGIVYEAEQRSLGRRVALKVLPKHALLLEKDLKRFQREARTAAQLHHTNIVPVFGVGEQDGLHYYVMPLVRGVGLDELIAGLRRPDRGPAAGPLQHNGIDASARDFRDVLEALIAMKFGERAAARPARLPDDSQWPAPRGPRRTSYWRIVARIGVQAAEAIAHAHASGTLHRDIKPSNLLVDADGAVCVADFGLARAVDREDAHSEELAGTVRYMAPEQFQGRADARSDLYALGLTLYELLTLQPAFLDADRRRSLDGRHASAEPVRPRKLDPSIPRDLETVLLKCLADDPSKRYPMAAALAADLKCFLGDRPIQARRAGWAQRAWRWCLRNPALAGMSAMAGMLLLAVVLTASAGYFEAKRAYREATGALARAEATAELSLDVLDDIYRQLSPDRVWISSVADPGGAACACIGLRSGDPSPPAAGRIAAQVQASRETAALLEHLLVFYDRLAEQAGGDFRVMLESAVAGRRVGDIRQRLGQVDQAERAYRRAVEKLAELRNSAGMDADVAAELARTCNELGNVQSARLDDAAALQSHEEALSVIQSLGGSGSLRADGRYELARTLYLLSSKRPSVNDPLRKRDPAGALALQWPHAGQADDERASAIRILEELAREYPEAPDYQFLLALCLRPSGVVPTLRTPAGDQGRRRAIQILEDLKAKYPGVADYRYELTATYAWVPVGLFPWQGRFAAAPAVEDGLLKSLHESQWLVAHNPTIPHYATSQALVLAKLGTVCWDHHRLAESEGYFQKALDVQDAVVAEFPDLPSHNKVLVEFFRLRLGQVRCERSIQSGDRNGMRESRALLEQCIGGLTELAGQPELGEDRLARTSLPVARHALGRAVEAIGKDER